MEASKENAPWLSVPQFGNWDQKGELPDYSMDFTKVRAMRKQNKRDVSRASLGNEQELMSTTTKLKTGHRVLQHYHQNHCPAGRLILYLKTKGKSSLFSLFSGEVSVNHPYFI
ncbi:uncharacterized protein LOC132286498 isoform X2 [Cornus florida]|uniref:uncharacterized protein LOC132286498 isoform X2 n=1 Tax=Cornus florida TaxID=4283 RepID=UPI0028A1190F|nr:uncharacterized protein LOC132286498 isoform X2 [Cornus florida]